MASGQWFSMWCGRGQAIIDNQLPCVNVANGQLCGEWCGRDKAVKDTSCGVVMWPVANDVACVASEVRPVAVW